MADETKKPGVFDEIITLVAKLQEIEGYQQRKEKPPESLPPIFEVKDKLDRKFWATAANVAESVVEKDLPDDLTFSREQEFFLNFGIIPHETTQWAYEECKALLDGTAKDGFYTVCFQTDVLNKQYRLTKRVDRMKELVHERDTVKGAIDNHPGEVGDLHHERDSAVRSTLGGDADKCIALFNQWEKLQVPFLEMEMTSRRGGFSGKEQILKFNRLRENLAEAKSNISNLLSRHPEHKMAIEEYVRSLITKHKELLSLKLDMEQAENAIYKEEHEVKNINDSKCKEELRGAVMLTKGMMTIAARKAGMSPGALPLKKCRLITPDEIRQCLTHIEDYDPKVFNNRRVKKNGRPEVVIVPGIGGGVYDFVNDRLMLPLMIPKDALQAVSSAVCMYRDDIDQQLNERQMIGAFKREIKENNKVRSAIKLRAQFLKWYLVWMVKEANGIASLDRKVRAWFEYRIGPKKMEPRTPIEMRGLSSKQLKAIREELKAKDSLEARDYERMAIVHFFLDEKPTALELILKAVEAAPEEADIQLNAGIIHKACNKDAKPFLQTYMRNAEQSWWTKKAQELMR